MFHRARACVRNGDLGGCLPPCAHREMHEHRSARRTHTDKRARAHGNAARTSIKAEVCARKNNTASLLTFMVRPMDLQGRFMHLRLSSTSTQPLLSELRRVLSPQPQSFEQADHGVIWVRQPPFFLTTGRNSSAWAAVCVEEALVKKWPQEGATRSAKGITTTAFKTLHTFCE